MTKYLTEKDIRRFADSKRIFERGMGYYRRGYVRSIKLLDGVEGITAKVDGNYGPYDVDIRFYEDDLEAACDCPYDGYVCKHIVAVLLHCHYEFKDIHTLEEKYTKSKDSWNITLEEILELTSQTSVFESLDLFKKKKVKILSMAARKLVVKINEKPQTERWYRKPSVDYDRITVKIERSWYRDRLDIECNCSLYSRTKCKHVAAALLALFLRNSKKTPIEAENEVVSKIRAEKFRSLVCELDSITLEKPSHKTTYEFFFNTAGVVSPYRDHLRKARKFSLKIEKRRILKSGRSGATSLVKEKFLKKYYDTIPRSRKMAFDLFIQNLKYTAKWGWDSGNSLVKEYFDEDADGNLLLVLRKLYLEDPQAFRNCVFSDEKGEIEIHVEGNEKRKKSRLKIMANLGEQRFNLSEGNVTFLGKDPLWISAFDEKKKCFFVFEANSARPEIIKKLADFSDAELDLDQLNDFIEEHYLKLSALVKVILPKEYEVEERTVEPAPRLFLRDHLDSFSIELRFLYEQEEVPYTNRHDIVFRDDDGKIVKITRDRAAEKKYFLFLLENHTKERNEYLVPSIDPYVWLADVANELVSRGYEIYGKSELFNTKVASDEPKLMLKVSSGIDWFDLKGSLSFGKEKVSFDELIGSINNHERFIKLSDGSRGVIPKKWLDRLSGTIGLLESDEKGGAKASRSQIALVEALLDIAEESKVDKKFREMKDKFSRFKAIKSVSLPKKLKGKLRPYQKAGYDWLHFLKDFSFGGCLADEMGLGKTVQVLSLLLHEKERGIKIPSLVVVPRSLMFNWENEVEKFTPYLKTHIHHGSGRAKEGDRIWNEKRDLIITTYATLRNDADIFQKKTFHYVVLDESQHIKNSLSKTARAIYGMSSKYRLAVTGTPIENNSLELWSQFAFLNPGLLGNIKYFKDTFVKSIEREKDKAKTKALRHMIYPFLLMRKKEMVAKDLPEKQISISYCAMNAKQRKIYASCRSRIRKEIEAAVREEGLARSRFKILQGLTKLRQICNHPVLLDESFIGSSGKFDMLMEMLKEVMAEGHKVLIFSSFVKMLHIFRNEFEKNNILFSYLDGSTRKRKEQVENFQNDPDIRTFLISLKAGGLGLNLTEADYVFIVDPWWNPAAEMQAIDRTHRIGQTKSVFVYKAITKDSVEEKILELQESKLDLVKNVIAVDEGLFKRLDKDAINKLFA